VTCTYAIKVTIYSCRISATMPDLGLDWFICRVRHGRLASLGGQLVM
jgi:hypothetical protein